MRMTLFNIKLNYLISYLNNGDQSRIKDNSLFLKTI